MEERETVIINGYEVPLIDDGFEKYPEYIPDFVTDKPKEQQQQS